MQGVCFPGGSGSYLHLRLCEDHRDYAEGRARGSVQTLPPRRRRESCDAEVHSPEEQRGLQAPAGPKEYIQLEGCLGAIPAGAE